LYLYLPLITNYLSNISLEVCAKLQRGQEHVRDFVMAELGIEANLDASLRLVMKGKFIQKQIESLLRRYVLQYVSCHMCKSFNTVLSRDVTSRLSFVECRECSSSMSVAPIKAGYVATTRAIRRAERNAKAWWWPVCVCVYIFAYLYICIFVYLNVVYIFSTTILKSICVLCVYL